jgi:hypothetical protein
MSLDVVVVGAGFVENGFGRVVVIGGLFLNSC